jgi:hypothetical protein
MIFQRRKTCFERNYVILSIFFLLVFVPLIAGCTPYAAIKKETKKITQKLTGSDGALKKKIAIVLFDNKTSFTDQDFEEVFHAHLVETVKDACPDMLLLKPGDEGYPDIFITLPKKLSGRVDGLALAKTGRLLGLNAIVIGSLTDIRDDEEERGILWFKDSHRFIHVQAMAEVYDTETGAKIVDQSFVNEIDIKDLDTEVMELKKEVDVTFVADAVGRLTIDIGESICRAVKRQPWKGYIISTSGDEIILSSGEKVGLKPGDILDVHDSGNIIHGMEDEQFFIPGLKTGEIKITVVYPESAEAVLNSGGEIKAGSSVRLKKD